jgi:hypothetical protein
VTKEPNPSYAGCKTRLNFDRAGVSPDLRKIVSPDLRKIVIHPHLEPHGRASGECPGKACRPSAAKSALAVDQVFQHLAGPPKCQALRHLWSRKAGTAQRSRATHEGRDAEDSSSAWLPSSVMVHETNVASIAAVKTKYHRQFQTTTTDQKPLRSSVMACSCCTNRRSPVRPWAELFWFAARSAWRTSAG